MKQFLFNVALLVILACASTAHAKTYEREQIVFGNVPLRIQIDTTGSDKNAFRDIETGFAIAQRMNAIFSTYLPTSESSTINALKKPITNYQPSAEYYAALVQGLRFSQITGGYFDITFAMPYSALAQIKLKSGRRVDLLDPKLTINLTGLIKGYTVDKIIASLKKHHRIIAATVAASGDIRHFDRSGKTQAVQLYNPHPNQAPIFVTLGNQAVSTSGFYERGRHIKNTRHSRVEHQQVSVIANQCLISDAFDNGMMFMPISMIKAILTQFPGMKVIVYDRLGHATTID